MIRFIPLFLVLTVFLIGCSQSAQATSIRFCTYGGLEECLNLWEMAELIVEGEEPLEVEAPVYVALENINNPQDKRSVGPANDDHADHLSRMVYAEERGAARGTLPLFAEEDEYYVLDTSVLYGGWEAIQATQQSPPPVREDYLFRLKKSDIEVYNLEIEP